MDEMAQVTPNPSDYLISIATEILQNLLLCIYPDTIDHILKHGFDITFPFEAISKIIHAASA